jgi:predicted GNAT family N-acyltransferase
MANSSVVIRKIEPGEEQQACLLVKRVFDEYVAPLYETEGVEEFLRYVDPDRMVNRLSSNHFVLIAKKGENLLGVIEIRDFIHVSLLFVTGNAQRQGIAKQLLEEALEICQSKLALSEVSVHSSPNAVEAYKKLGFKVKGQEQLENGIRYIPMKLRIRTDDDS